MTRASKHSTTNPAIASLIIRLGLAAVFAYAAIDAFREPDAWIYFVPSFHPGLSAKETLDILSVLQLGLVIWLLSGKYVKCAASIAIAFLAGLMLFNLDTILITFRDIGLIAAAAALWFLDD